MFPPHLLLTPHYLLPLASLPYLRQSSNICIDIHSFYEKQTFQNRSYINTSQGIQKLIIPIQHSGKKQRYCDVKIDYTTPWATQHIRTFSTVYGKAPFYHAVADLLFPLLEKKPPFLLDLSLSTLQIILRFLDLTPKITLTQDYLADTPADTLDIRAYFHPKKKSKSHFPLPSYHSLFAHPIVPHLSSIDLLFCEGLYASTLLEDSFPQKISS